MICPLRIKVESPYDKAKYCLCSNDELLDCQELDGPAIVTFNTGDIDVGEKFKVCYMYDTSV